MITITHTHNGFFVGGAVRPHNPRGTHEWLITCRYAIGQLPRRYPVPAIRQYFAWELEQGPYRVGTDLFQGSIVLVHYEQVAYDP